MSNGATSSAGDPGGGSGSWGDAAGSLLSGGSGSWGDTAGGLPGADASSMSNGVTSSSGDSGGGSGSWGDAAGSLGDPGGGSGGSVASSSWGSNSGGFSTISDGTTFSPSSAPTLLRSSFESADASDGDQMMILLTVILSVLFAMGITILSWTTCAERSTHVCHVRDVEHEVAEEQGSPLPRHNSDAQSTSPTIARSQASRVAVNMRYDGVRDVQPTVAYVLEGYIEV